MELTPPPPFPPLKRTFLLPSGSVYQGLRFRIAANELCFSVLLPWVTHLFLLMSNLGFSLRYLPFGKACLPACLLLLQHWHCLTALSAIRLRSVARKSLSPASVCMDGLFDQICTVNCCLNYVSGCFSISKLHSRRSLHENMMPL